MIQHLAIKINEIKEVDVFFDKLKKLINKCMNDQIPVLTLNFPDSDYDVLEALIKKILKWDEINKEKIKINVFGKWYDLAWRVIEEIKNMINETKHYDSFFLNFCIEYDGQEEIVDACRLLSKLAKLDKISPESISKNDIKENIYTSAFMPPEKIIILKQKKLDGFLLWDSKNSKIEFLDKCFEELDIDEALSI